MDKQLHGSIERSEAGRGREADVDGGRAQDGEDRLSRMVREEERGRRSDDEEDRDRELERVSARGHGREYKSPIADASLKSVSRLAQVKDAFDRFSVDGLMTGEETVQALNELGTPLPRSALTRYLRSRRLLRTSRHVSFFEFLRAIAATCVEASGASEILSHRRQDDAVAKDRALAFGARGRWVVGRGSE